MGKETVHASPDNLEAFFGTLAHDLNNILSLILGNISLVMGMYLHEEKPLKTLAKAEQAALKARELAQQLAIYARYGTVTKAECDVAALLQEAAGLVLHETSATVDLSQSEDLFAIKGDMEQLNQVIRSLIIHCLKGMQSGGAIHIAAANAAIKKGDDLPVRPGNYVKISISQEAGLRPEIPPQPLAQGSPSKGEHSVLSLNTVYYLIKKVIEKHGGHVTKETPRDQGLTFQVYLPAYCRKNAPKSDTAKEQGKTKGRVLIIGDEEMVRTNVGMILDFLGYEVEFASDGSQAVELYLRQQANHQPFDAVLVDLSVRGGMSGRETLDNLLQVDPKVKAIVFSGNVNDPVVRDYQSIGFKGLIEKPYTVNDFSSVLDGVLI